jgi:hypothetical protein
MGTPDEPSPDAAPTAAAGMRWKSKLMWPVRFRLLRWLDRPLARLLGCQPRMLSSRVEVQQVPFLGTPRERFKAWLWSKHSVGWAIGTALASFVLMILAMYASSDSQPSPKRELGLIARALAHWLSDPSNERETCLTLAITAASVLAGLFGVVQTVLIFLVELREGRPDQAEAASPLILRRYFSFYILGFLAGTTAASLAALVSISLPWIPGPGIDAIASVNLIAVSIALAAALCLIVKILNEASESSFDLTLPVAKAGMRAQALQFDRDARSQEVLRAVLAAYGAELVDPDRIPREVAEHVDLELPLDSPGALVDVDCYRLGDAIGAARSAVPGSQVRLAILLGFPLRTPRGLILRFRPTMLSPEQCEAPDLPEVTRQRIVRHFLRAFQIRKGVPR